jgi:hypothetical protein
MPELVAIWLAGLVMLLLAFGVAAALLRFTASGREHGIALGELFTALAVCFALGCAVYTLLALAL